MPIRHLPAGELIDRCVRQPADEVAWQEFVRRYHQTIRSRVALTHRRIARQDSDRQHPLTEDVVDDLVQAVYVRLIEDDARALRRFAGQYENSIFGYLTMISINVVRDFFREVRAHKRPRVAYSLEQLVTGGEAGELSAGYRPYPLATVHNQSEAHTLADEIDSWLPRVVRGKNSSRDILIFRLRYYDGMTLEEISGLLDGELTPVSVGSVANRTLKKLRSLLRDSRRSAP